MYSFKRKTVSRMYGLIFWNFDDQLFVLQKASITTSISDIMLKHEKKSNLNNLTELRVPFQ